MIWNNPNVSLGIVDCSTYTRPTGYKVDYHKKIKDMIAFTPLDLKWFETLA